MVAHRAACLWYNAGALPGDASEGRPAYFIASDMTDDLTQHDRRKRRCPMLGHEIAFSYCRTTDSDVPCRRILDCWWEQFDVEAFFRLHYGQQELQKLLSPQPGKLTSLIDLIEKAKKASKQQED